MILAVYNLDRLICLRMMKSGVCMQKKVGSNVLEVMESQKRVSWVEGDLAEE